MFKQVFNLANERLQRPIHFHHIHGDGFVAVVSDLDWKQLKGLSWIPVDGD